MSSGPPKIQPYLGEVDPRALPLDAIRDLLDVVRALYSHRQRQGADKDELVLLSGAGRALREALSVGAAPFGDDQPGEARAHVRKACADIETAVRGKASSSLVLGACRRAMAPVYLSRREARRAALGRR